MSEWGVKGTIGIVPPKLPIHSSSPPPSILFFVEFVEFVDFLP